MGGFRPGSQGPFAKVPSIGGMEAVPAAREPEPSKETDKGLGPVAALENSRCRGVPDSLCSGL